MGLEFHADAGAKQFSVFSEQWWQRAGAWTEACGRASRHNRIRLGKAGEGGVVVAGVAGRGLCGWEGTGCLGLGLGLGLGLRK